MGIERYIAVASLGLYIMFAAEINVLFNFLHDPLDFIEPTPKLLQFISIGIAPAVILTAVAYIMSRRYGSRAIGTMTIIGGCALIIGMAHAHTLLDGIEAKFLDPAIVATPIVFGILGVPVIVVGAMLLRSKGQPKRSSQDFSSWQQSEG